VLQTSQSYPLLSLTRPDLDNKVFLEVTADVGIANQVDLQIGRVPTNLSLAHLEGKLSLDGYLSLEIGDLFDSEELASLRMAHDDPPFFALLLWVVLREDRFAKHFKCLGVIIFVALERHEQLYSLFDRVFSDRVAISATRCLVFDLDHGVAVANFSELGHLVVRNRHQLVSLVVLHVHKVTDLLDAALLLQSLAHLSIEAR